MLLFIEGYPYNLDEIVKDGLSVRDVLKDVVSVPVKEDKYSFEYICDCQTILDNIVQTIWVSFNK
jgi:hypothetical protein